MHVTALATRGIRLTFDPGLGLIEGFVVADGSARIAPLHRAAWVGGGWVLPMGLAPHLYCLGGNFFCAPFGQASQGAPMHGWPANTRWNIWDKASDHLSAQLVKTVSGAHLTNHLWLRPDHPFV